MTLKELISKVEGAVEGSRELDIEIMEAIGWRCPGWDTESDATKALFPDRLGYNWFSDTSPGYHGDVTSNPFTTSLDAALTLVPGGKWWVLNSGVQSGTSLCQLEGDDGGWTTFKAHAATPALALCAACLKARLGENG